jgi:hypothetical protein
MAFTSISIVGLLMTSEQKWRKCDDRKKWKRSDRKCDDMKK